VVVGRELLKDAAKLAAWGEFRKKIATELFNRATVEIHLCDEGLNVIQVLKPSLLEAIFSGVGP